MICEFNETTPENIMSVVPKAEGKSGNLQKLMGICQLSSVSLRSGGVNVVGGGGECI